MDDYLRHTMPKNIGSFDHYYVVISQADKVSEHLCRDFGAKPVLFENFFFENYAFNKSGGIRAAQNLVHRDHPDAWVAIMDVDILVDGRLSELDFDSLDPKCLYGMSRFDAHTYNDYKAGKFKRHPGTARGKIIGYFQMYFDKSKYYAEKSKNACGCDVAFASAFGNNLFLENMRAIHIGKAASHWNGRNRKRLDWPD